MLRLITIPISHYSEKARWALDRAGLHYREERHIQGIHRVAARHAGGGATVPVLVTADGAIGESHEILVWTDAQVTSERRLFPAEPGARAEVDALCRRLDDRLGPPGRRLVYVHMFRQPKLVFAFNDQGVPAWEDGMLRAGWPLMKRFVARALGIVPGGEAHDEAAVFHELDHVAELLSDGRPYLSRRALRRRGPDLRGNVRPGDPPARVRGRAAAARCAGTRDGRARAARTRAPRRALRARAVRRAPTSNAR